MILNRFAEAGEVAAPGRPVLSIGDTTGGFNLMAPVADRDVARLAVGDRAGEIRFLPVLLTSATAIGGLLPLALEGSGLYSPLACVIIGGLVTSTLLSRIVTPVMYLLLAPRGRKAKAHETEIGGAPQAV